MDISDIFAKYIIPAAGAYLTAKNTPAQQTVSQWQTPYFQPYQEELVRAAQQLTLGYPPPTYSGQTWAGPTQDTYSAWDAARSWASGTPYSSALSSQASRLLGGSPFNAPTNVAKTNLSDLAVPRPEFLDMARGGTQQVSPSTVSGVANASNPYLGMSVPGIAGVGNAYDRISSTVGGSPMMAGVTNASAATNPLFGLDNPYTSRAIDAATLDIDRKFNQNTMPQLDRLMQQSGSFGNTGVQQLQRDAISDYTRDVGNVVNEMRLRDLFAQQQLGEADAARRTGISQFNAGAANAASLANAANANQYALGYGGLLGGLLSSDLARQLGTQQFNAGLSQADISRNASLAQQLGMYNAGALNDMSRFNATMGQNAALANQSAINNMLQYGLNAYNQGSQFNAAQANAMNQFNASQGNAMNQFNTAADWNAYNTGLGLLNQQDLRSLNAAGALGNIGAQQQAQLQSGLDAAQKNWAAQTYAPFNYLSWYGNILNQANGGNTTSSNMYGNPWAAGLGAGLSLYQLMNP